MVSAALAMHARLFAAPFPRVPRGVGAVKDSS
jgi:hypothetical protein